MSNQLDRLLRAVSQDAAIRRVRRLQPTGGRGDKIFPSTYPVGDKPSHAFEYRYVGATNERRLCVLIDSVQSQANRLEEALVVARAGGDVSLPAIVVDFQKSEVPDVGQLSTLEVPHRIFDAIIRDSELGKVPFLHSSEDGKRLKLARPQNARAIFEMSPTALVFGAWNSTGEGGGLGAKFPRAVVSEIVGMDVVTEPTRRSGRDDGRRGEDEGRIERASGVRTGSRIDPLGIRASVRIFKTPDGQWSIDGANGASGPSTKKSAAGDTKASGGDAKASGKEGKPVKPSEVNHSNIAPSIDMLGVTVDHALHTFVLSCGALRRLSFGPESTKGAASKSKEGDVAARATLAALGLFAAVAQDRSGYYLRSRCDLVPEPGQSSDFEIVRADGTTEAFSLDYDKARALVAAAHARAAEYGVRWRGEDIVLTPQKKLVELVKQSREKALQGEEEAPNQ